MVLDYLLATRWQLNWIEDCSWQLASLSFFPVTCSCVLVVDWSFIVIVMGSPEANNLMNTIHWSWFKYSKLCIVRRLFIFSQRSSLANRNDYEHMWTMNENFEGSQIGEFALWEKRCLLFSSLYVCWRWQLLLINVLFVARHTIRETNDVASWLLSSIRRRRRRFYLIWVKVKLRM